MGLFLIAFDSTHQALRAEMLLEDEDLDIDIFPTPKTITAGCALCIQFQREDLAQVQRTIKEQEVEIRGIFYQVEQGNYKLIAEEEDGE